MKRASVALGILGLVWAVAMPAAEAKGRLVCQQQQFIGCGGKALVL
jgi:hypothetical protein